MPPIKYEPRSTRIRDALERIGSELFDDEDQEVRDFIERRRPVSGTPRQRFVRHFANRWGEFHKNEEDHDAEVGRFLVAMVRPFAIVIAVAFIIWLGNFIASIHFSLALPSVKLNSRLGVGIGFILGAAALMWMNKRNRR